MANEVYIEREEGTAYRVDLGPVHMIEDTYTKTPMIVQTYDDSIGAQDPETLIEDTKETLHRFVITGVLTLNDGDAINKSDDKYVTTLVQSNVEGVNDSGSKIGRLRLLYGYGSVEKTKLNFNYNGFIYNGFMTRLTLTRAGGENFYEYIIEIIEALYEWDGTI